MCVPGTKLKLPGFRQVPLHTESSPQTHIVFVCFDFEPEYSYASEAILGLYTTLALNSQSPDPTSRVLG